MSPYTILETRFDGYEVTIKLYDNDTGEKFTVKLNPVELFELKDNGCIEPVTYREN